MRTRRWRKRRNRSRRGKGGGKNPSLSDQNCLRNAGDGTWGLGASSMKTEIESS